MRSARRLTIGLVGLTALLTAGCDTEPLTDAVDNFKIQIEFPAINTVVAGQVVDAGTRRPLTVPVTLTFGGTNGGRIIDAFSDKITTQTIGSGLTSFGIENTVVPSATSPATFTVTASAAGYATRTETVSLTEVGSGSFTINLVPTSLTAAIPGTATASATGTATNGTAATTITATSAPLPGAPSASTLEVAQGAALTTATGAPLTGAVTAQIRAISEEAYDVLPQAVRVAGGVFQPVAAAVNIEIRDGAGNVAGNASSAAAFRSVLPVSQAAAAVANVTAFVGLNQANFDRVKALVNGGSTLQVRNANGVVAGCSASLDAARVGVLFSGSCIGNLAAVTVPSNPPATCSPSAVLSVNNPNALRIRVRRTVITSPSVHAYKPESFDLLTGSSQVNLANVVYSAAVPTGSNYTVSVETDAGVASVSGVNICSGTHAVTLPTATNLANFTVTAQVSCPNDQSFDPQFGSASRLDALMLFYRESTAGSITTNIRAANTVKTVQSGRITLRVTSLGLIRGQTYDIEAVFDDRTGRQSVTAPSTGNVIDLNIAASDVGLKCA